MRNHTNSDPPFHLKFVVPMVPVAQPRQRVAARIDSNGKAVAMNYGEQKDHPIHEFRYHVRRCAMREMAEVDEPPTEAAVRMNLTFVFPRPKSRKNYGDQRLWFDRRPDIDNLVKAVMDALNTIVFTDDKLVCHLVVKKYYGQKHESPHVKVAIVAGVDIPKDDLNEKYMYDYQ